MNIDVFTTLSQEHETLLPLILAIQAAAESGDGPSLLERLAAGCQALTTELDAHIALEDDVAFATVEEALGKQSVLPFRLEHNEIRTLRDQMLAGADAGRVSIDLCLQFCALLQEHMQREDAMLFPSTRTALALGTPVTSPHRESEDGMDHHPSPQVFHALDRQALEVRPGPYGAVGTLFSGEGLEAVWIYKQNESIDPDWFSQDSVDLLVVLQGQLCIEFACPGFLPYLLQPGDVLVLPAQTACRASRWPREGEQGTIFLAIYPQREPGIRMPAAEYSNRERSRRYF